MSYESNLLNYTARLQEARARFDAEQDALILRSKQNFMRMGYSESTAQMMAEYRRPHFDATLDMSPAPKPASPTYRTTTPTYRTATTPAKEAYRTDDTQSAEMRLIEAFKRMGYSDQAAREAARGRK